MFLFLHLDLLYLRYQNVYADIICADIVYPPEENYLYLLIFPPLKGFLDVCYVENDSPTRNTSKLPKY